MKITIKLIKELRILTGLGILECKNALIKNKGNIKLSIDYLRKLGNIKFNKRSLNIVSQGLVFSSIRNNIGVILKLQCETDFVAKNIILKQFGNKIINYMLNNEIGDIIIIRNVFDNERKKISLQVCENIIITKSSILKNTKGCISSYLHGSRIAVLVTGNFNSNPIIKKIAMHIAACNPKYLSKHNIPKNIINDEYEIQMKSALNQVQSKEIAKKIVYGRMKKFINNITLLGQIFIFENNIFLSDILKKYNASIISFIRFSV